MDNSYKNRSDGGYAYNQLEVLKNVATFGLPKVYNGSFVSFCYDFFLNFGWEGNISNQIDYILKSPYIDSIARNFKERVGKDIIYELNKAKREDELYSIFNIKPTRADLRIAAFLLKRITQSLGHRLSKEENSINSDLPPWMAGVPEIGRKYSSIYFDKERYIRWNRHVERILQKSPRKEKDMLQLIIHPSYYDSDGYVIRAWKGFFPCGTLNTLHALNLEWNKNNEIQIHSVIWDEFVHGVVSKQLLIMMKEFTIHYRLKPVIVICGVKTAQWPRARDIALLARSLELTVLVGGFHISGHKESQRFLNERGITTGFGEAEGYWNRLISDCISGRLLLNYKATKDDDNAIKLNDSMYIANFITSPLPVIDKDYISEYDNCMSIELTRGCRNNCSFCCIKNVLGRETRSRSPQNISHWFNEAADKGIQNIFLTDDNLYHSPNWKGLLKEIREVRRRRNWNLQMLVQADTRCAEDQEFLDLAAEAGIRQIYMGLETTNPENLSYAGKWSNIAGMKKKKYMSLVDYYREVVTACNSVGIDVVSSTILGFPNDGLGCGEDQARMLRSLGIPLALIHILTPWTGSDLYETAAIKDKDFNFYDMSYAVIDHPRMTAEELYNEWLSANRTFYSPASTISWFLQRGNKNTTTQWSRISYEHSIYDERQFHSPFLGLGSIRLYDTTIKREAITDEDAARLWGG